MFFKKKSGKDKTRKKEIDRKEKKKNQIVEIKNFNLKLLGNHNNENFYSIYWSEMKKNFFCHIFFQGGIYKEHRKNHIQENQGYINTEVTKDSNPIKFLYFVKF